MRSTKQRKNLNGYKLEVFVENLYKQLGYVSVKRNITIRKSGMKYQIDIMYKRMDNLIPKTVFVEVKYKKQGSKVGLEEVAKFYSVLELLNHEPRYSEFVTNSYFTMRAEKYCARKGIKMINGPKLWELTMKVEENKDILQEFMVHYYKLLGFVSNARKGHIIGAIQALTTPRYKGSLDEQIRRTSLKQSI